MLRLIQEKLSVIFTTKFLRYLIVGFLSVGLDFTIFWFLINVMSLWYILAQLVNGIAVLTFNFTAHRWFTFQSTNQRKREQLPRYLLLNGWNYVASLGMLYLLVEVVGLTPIPAKIITIGVIILWNFQILNRFIYRSEEVGKS